MSPFTFARTSFGFWFGGIFLLVGLPLMLTSAFLVYDDWRFAQEAQSTQGTVLAKKITQSIDRDSRKRTSHYEVTYQFTAGGVTIEGRDEVPRAEWERLKEREPVEILYRPQRPVSNHVAGPRPWLLKTVFGLLGSVFTVIGATVLIRSARQARLESRLRQHGVSAHGTVTQLRERSFEINGVQQWRLHYEYRDGQDHPHAKTIDMPADEAQQWKVGDIGKVLYDAARPAEAVWLGRS